MMAGNKPFVQIMNYTELIIRYFMIIFHVIYNRTKDRIKQD